MGEGDGAGDVLVGAALESPCTPGHKEAAEDEESAGVADSLGEVLETDDPVGLADAVDE